ncbi:hypothetical protein NEICINOT_03099 [Neisseria cinerea ATCC 14685]|uniref:Uncharacterized protein n=1 Tax=Neisseria cinerea ATCC 14685 TaxID=546262 RepID=D0W0D4_NEICI|nr:hypothetical protein NEICINOT_03099 [Neisseria cinerea ATCC 14685]
MMTDKEKFIGVSLRVDCRGRIRIGLAVSFPGWVEVRKEPRLMFCILKYNVFP